MNKFRHLFYLLFKKPSVVLEFLWGKMGWLLPDELYLKVHYRLIMGKKLDLNNPVLFSEKLQWLKLFNRKPEYTTMVDKYAAKDYVAKIIGKEHIIPTLGVWNRPEEIEWDKLPKQFCLKCTHDSGTIIVVKDKDQIDKKETIKKLKKWLRRNYYSPWREWPYKDVPRRVIAEQYLVPDINDKYPSDLYDYKFFSFNGEPQVLLFCSERKNGTSKWDFYDMEMQKMPVTAMHHKQSNIQLNDIITKEVFAQMKEIARSLAKDKAYVSVDLYYVNGQIYFGEMTFFSGSGYLRYEPKEFDLTLGNMLVLPQKTI